MAKVEVGGTATYFKAKEMKKGQVFEGTFIETKESTKYKGNFAHMLQTPEGMIGINGGGLLDFKMKYIAPGQYVYLTYGGMEKLTKGTFAGSDSHQWKVEIDDEADSAPSARKDANFASDEEIPF